MSESKQQPRLPVVGEYVRGIGTLVEVQDVTPPVVKLVDWIFRDTSAQVKCRVNGKVIKDYSTFNNFYGIDTCVPNAIEDAQKMIEKIGPSDLEFIVVKTTSHCRHRPTGQERFYDKQFVDFHWLDHGSHWQVPDDIVEIVWSSKGDIPATPQS